ncbi:SURF1 family protein [Streptomyces sp. NPDC004959]|uniref:SURF1 family protein n=1 Tax=unclassified Streptomyces TaxID=2593676 RepID=UPI0004C7CCE9|nr:SURF1 family protein [Streptomyces sp. NRRL F-5630]
MYRFLLTPRWWGIHVFVLLAIPFCVFMGSWQLSRFEDRVDTHKDAEATAEAHADGAARPLAEVLPVTSETSGQRTRATGRYVEQLLVPDRGLDDRDGYYVLGLLRTGEDKVLPVVRGWHEGPAPAKAPAAPTGTVTVTGALQPSEDARSTGVHASGGLPAGQVGIIGAASLVNLTSYDVYDGWITLDRAEAGLTPVPAKTPEGHGLDLKAFQNLGYTGEWFVFAGFVVFMWYRLVRREAEARRDAELGIAAEEEPQPEPEPTRV